MTRDELISAISHAIVVGESNYIPSKLTAEAILNTIFAALKEPTEEMIFQGYNSDDFVVEPSECWQAILSASALAPEKEE